MDPNVELNVGLSARRRVRRATRTVQTAGTEPPAACVDAAFEC